MKKTLLCVFAAILLAAPSAFPQTVVGIGTNALGWGCLTPNLGLEVGFGHFSLSLDGGCNPFTLKDNRPIQFWAVQPEFRYWFKSPLNGHAIGLHGLYGDYNLGLRRYRYDGAMYGGGISYAYAWRFLPRWCLEGSVGFGYTRLDNRNVYEREDRYTCYGPSAHNCWNISKAAVKITWIIADKPRRTNDTFKCSRPSRQTSGTGFGEALRKIDKLNRR